MQQLLGKDASTTIRLYRGGGGGGVYVSAGFDAGAPACSPRS